MSNSKLKLYLISQGQATGYDTYDSAVVCAKSFHDARQIHPSVYAKAGDFTDSTWADSPEHVAVRCIGEANPGMERGVVLASFNAG